MKPKPTPPPAYLLDLAWAIADLVAKDTLRALPANLINRLLLEMNRLERQAAQGIYEQNRAATGTLFHNQPL